MNIKPDLPKIIEDALFETKLIHNQYFRKKDAVLSGKFGGDSKGDAVTKADQEAEARLRQLYEEMLPGYNFLGEETGHKATYNGNGLFTINDPLDGTWNFSRGILNFGTITSIVEQGQVIAAGYSNTPRQQTFIATRERPMLRINLGSQRNDQPEPQIYLGSGPADDQEQIKELAALVKEKFPGIKLSEDGAAINAAYVFTGFWPILFHTGLAQHDISPVSLFSEITAIPATDHRGHRYLAIDPVAEIERYKLGRQDIIYHNPILMAEPKIHDQMLRILERFYPLLDAKQRAK